MPSDLLFVKWECCYLTIQCAVDKFHRSLQYVRTSLPQGYLNREMSLSGKQQVLTIRGEQSCESSQKEAWNSMWQKKEKGGTKWENELNISTQHPRSDILTSSHGAILWIMPFRWPIIRSSWKSYGNVSVHSVSNCKILGPNFLIRAWNGNQNDG